MNKSKMATLINPPLEWLARIVPHSQPITTQQQHWVTAPMMPIDDANLMVSTYIGLIPDKGNITNICKFMIRIRSEQMTLKSNNNNNDGFILDESNSTNHTRSGNNSMGHEHIRWKSSSWGRAQYTKTFITGTSKIDGNLNLVDVGLLIHGDDHKRWKPSSWGQKLSKHYQPLSPYSKFLKGAPLYAL